MHNTLRSIMKREKFSGEYLARQLGISAFSIRRMLTGKTKMDVQIFSDALEKLGYKIMIVKKEDIV